MNIQAFKITPVGNVPIQTPATTLDEMTQKLPQGFYTTFSTRAQGTKVMGLHMHLQRLYTPAMEQGIKPSVNKPDLQVRIAGLVKINLPKETRIRLILTKDDGMIYAGVQPFEPPSKEIYEKGVKVISAELARRTPRVKYTEFISSSIEQRKLVGGDVYEILLVKGGRFLEGMTSNFYAIKGGKLVTARNGILLGVTRSAVLKLARGQGMSIDYRSPRVGEKFDEAFLTSSSRGVVPIISIDKRKVGQGKVGKWTKILSKAYQAYVEERSENLVE
jgi:branched-chain amino acid aminotransferase